MEENLEQSRIMLLPNEILFMILKYIKCRDILNFGATCKKFHTYVSTNDHLWKEKFKFLLPVIYDYVRMNGGDWFEELKIFFNAKRYVYKELLQMSPKHYGRKSEILMQDVEIFFDVALDHHYNYFYVTNELKKVVKSANVYLNLNYCERPYTLTEQYYAKTALRYLTHTYLAIKYIQDHFAGNMRPEVVLNFFVQWVDPSSFHRDEDVDAAINELVNQVEKRLPTGESEPYSSVSARVDKGVLSHLDVLKAVSIVLYEQNHIALIQSANLDTLDLVRVVKTKCGHRISLAVLYQAVANRCGVYCELIAFPDHLFLEWRSPDPHGPPRCRIDLESGALLSSGRCPYANHGIRHDFRYCPDAFIQYLNTAFFASMGNIRNWNIQNASYLIDFWSASPTNENQYRHYRDFLQESELMHATATPIQPEFLDDNHIQMMKHLVSVTQHSVPIQIPVQVKKHDPGVMFAVGLICYQQKYDYLCVIVDWDTKCSEDMRNCAEFKTLRFGFNQPFYTVIAIDMSERYVAQENLQEVARPNRLYHLEDTIAKYFTHFDGFCYVPNQEKENQYPDDGSIRAVFRNKSDLRADRIREVVRRAQV